MTPRILVVDDEDYIRDLLSNFLEQYGCRVDTADGVESALARMQTNLYDVILTDKNMPDEDGDSEGGLRLLKQAKTLMPLSLIHI